MAQKTDPDKPNDLREFIKENDQRIYDFCFYMLHGSLPVEDFVISVFRAFVPEYHRLARPGSQETDKVFTRLRLFQFTWEKVRASAVSLPYASASGRDMRTLQQLDEDLLEYDAKDKGFLARSEDAILERLLRVDFDFRAPLVLRDVLGFSDDEAVEILGLRWPVYRHRLHRGRVDFKDALRGWAVRSSEERKGALLP